MGGCTCDGNHVDETIGGRCSKCCPCGNTLGGGCVQNCCPYGKTNGIDGGINCAQHCSCGYINDMKTQCRQCCECGYDNTFEVTCRACCANNCYTRTFLVACSSSCKSRSSGKINGNATVAVSCSSQPQILTYISSNIKLFKVNGIHDKNTKIKYINYEFSLNCSKNDDNLSELGSGDENTNDNKPTSSGFINIDYNSLNFLNKQNYLCISGTINYLFGTPCNQIMISPFITRMTNVNILTTVLSFKLINKIPNKISETIYDKTMLKYTNKIMKFYTNSLIPYIVEKCKDKKTPMKQCIKNNIENIINKNALTYALFKNVYCAFPVGNVTLITYCHRQMVKIMFVRLLLIKFLKINNVDQSNYVDMFSFENFFYNMIWNTIIKKNKITSSCINKTFNYLHKNLFDKIYDKIFKKIFKFIDSISNQTNWILMLFELTCDKMTQSELLQINNNNAIDICSQYHEPKHIGLLQKLYLTKVNETQNIIKENNKNNISYINVDKIIDEYCETIN